MSFQSVREVHFEVAKNLNIFLLNNGNNNKMHQSVYDLQFKTTWMSL